MQLTFLFYYSNLKKYEFKMIFIIINFKMFPSFIKAYQKIIKKLGIITANIIYCPEEEKTEALETIKRLCMESNFSIDCAKTLYFPERQDWFNPIVAK